MSYSKSRKVTLLCGFRADESAILCIQDEKTIWQKLLSQKEFLALEYHAIQKAHYAFRTPFPSFIQDSETGKSEKSFLNQEYLQLLIGL
jgi:hypothetical protein